MSFILDALIKSETERQRQTGPGFATVAGAGRRKGLPGWAVVLAALLLINVVAVLAVALWPDKEPAQTSTSTSAISPATSASVAGSNPAITGPPSTMNRAQPTTTSGRPEVRSLADEVDQPESNAPVKSRVTTGTRPARAGSVVYADEEADGPAQRGGYVVYQTADASPVSSDLPTLADLRSQGLLSIPDLHMDIHVYGETEEERFVFINMRKYKKGETLREGPVVDVILNDGVVLNERGLRFFLPSD